MRRTAIAIPVRGRGQAWIVSKVTKWPAGTSEPLSDLARGYRGHFAELMSAAEVLAKKGWITFDGNLVGVTQKTLAEVAPHGHLLGRMAGQKRADLRPVERALLDVLDEKGGRIDWSVQHTSAFPKLRGVSIRDLAVAADALEARGLITQQGFVFTRTAMKKKGTMFTDDDVMYEIDSEALPSQVPQNGKLFYSDVMATSDTGHAYFGDLAVMLDRKDVADAEHDLSGPGIEIRYSPTSLTGYAEQNARTVTFDYAEAEAYPYLNGRDVSRRGSYPPAVTIKAVFTVKRTRGAKESTMLREGKWTKENLPKGWTEESAKKWWATTTKGNKEHAVTECIKKVEGAEEPFVDDAGAFCASLADFVTGSTDWRKKKAAPTPTPAMERLIRKYQGVVDQKLRFGNALVVVFDQLRDAISFTDEANRQGINAELESAIVEPIADNNHRTVVVRVASKTATAFKAEINAFMDAFLAASAQYIDLADTLAGAPMKRLQNAMVYAMSDLARDTQAKENAFQAAMFGKPSGGEPTQYKRGPGKVLPNPPTISTEAAAWWLQQRDAVHYTFTRKAIQKLAKEKGIMVDLSKLVRSASGRKALARVAQQRPDLRPKIARLVRMAKEKYPWKDCIEEQTKPKGKYDEETAEKVCGKIKAQSQGLGEYAKKKKEARLESAGDAMDFYENMQRAAVQALGRGDLLTWSDTTNKLVETWLNKMARQKAPRMVGNQMQVTWVFGTYKVEGTIRPGRRGIVLVLKDGITIFEHAYAATRGIIEMAAKQVEPVGAAADPLRTPTEKEQALLRRGPGFVRRRRQERVAANVTSLVAEMALALPDAGAAASLILMLTEDVWPETYTPLANITRPLRPTGRINPALYRKALNELQFAGNRAFIDFVVGLLGKMGAAGMASQAETRLLDEMEGLETAYGMPIMAARRVASVQVRRIAARWLVARRKRASDQAIFQDLNSQLTTPSWRKYQWQEDEGNVLEQSWVSSTASPQEAQKVVDEIVERYPTGLKGRVERSPRGIKVVFSR